MIVLAPGLTRLEIAAALGLSITPALRRYIARYERTPRKFWERGGRRIKKGD